MLTKIVNGIEEIMSDEEEAQIRAEWVAYLANQAATAYIQQRANAIAALGDSNLYIALNGLTAYQAQIVDIIALYPAPV